MIAKPIPVSISVFMLDLRTIAPIVNAVIRAISELVALSWLATPTEIPYVAPISIRKTPAISVAPRGAYLERPSAKAATFDDVDNLLLSTV